ncbi:MAG: Flp family type IVb pilin [Pseudomonadota bacterium]|nr:Flp family type IVb pilin [Pseudomonadota bacterium]
MHKLANAVKDFLRDEDGLTMTEYAVAGSLVTLVAAVAFTALGTDIAAAIDNIRANMTAPGP